MFTVEIRINGSMIGHIYGHNEGENYKTGLTTYRYEYYRPESQKIVNGSVLFKRNDGIEDLIRVILEDYSEKTKKQKS